MQQLFLLIFCFFIASTVGAAPLRSTDKHLIPVPLTRQATDYTCGAAALQSVLGYYGENIREQALAKELRSDSVNGTKYENIAAFAKRHGLSVRVMRNATIESLCKILDDGIPAICLIQAWPERKVNYAKDWDDGHYVVAVGYDQNNIYFMDPCTLGNYTYIPKPEFLERWHDKTTGEKLVHFAMAMKKAKPAFDPLEIKKME